MAQKPTVSVHVYLHTHATRLTDTEPLALDYATGTTSTAKRNKAGDLADGFRATAIMCNAGPATLVQTFLFLLPEVLLDLCDAKMGPTAFDTALTRLRATLDGLAALTPEERRTALAERLALHQQYGQLLTTPPPDAATPSQADVDAWLRDMFTKMGLGDDTPPTTH